jgi:hypothetical protein
MGFSKLPPKDSPEAKELLKEYFREDPHKLARSLGYFNLDSMHRAFRYVYGVEELPNRNNQNPRVEEKEVKIFLPEVKLRDWKAPEHDSHDEEIALLQTSDGHAGKITETYNDQVYKQRMDAVFDSAMRIITLHRTMYPIKKLVIVNCGDSVQGENPYQGSTIGAVAMGEQEQIYKLALPAWVRLIGSLKQEFEEVEFHGIAGNHGHDKLAPETSRADLYLYSAIKSKLEEKAGITINVHDKSFGSIIPIYKWKFFAFHGDGIQCQQGVPLIAITKALLSWHMQYGGFDYALSGHFHKYHAEEISSRLKYFMCSTLVSDDEWALKKMKISSKPSQNILGVHEHRGVTWHYNLDVEHPIS